MQRVAGDKKQSENPDGKITFHTVTCDSSGILRLDKTAYMVFGTRSSAIALVLIVNTPSCDFENSGITANTGGKVGVNSKVFSAS